MNNRSMTDVAFDYLQNNIQETPFDVLWEYVCQQMNFSESVAMNKIASFYESLMLDNRFTCKDNNWDLSERHKYAETHVDLSAIELDDSRDDDDLDYNDQEDDLDQGRERIEEDEMY